MQAVADKRQADTEDAEQVSFMMDGGDKRWRTTEQVAGKAARHRWQKTQENTSKYWLVKANIENAPHETTEYTEDNWSNMLCERYQSFKSATEPVAMKHILKDLQFLLSVNVLEQIIFLNNQPNVLYLKAVIAMKMFPLAFFDA